MMTFRTYGKVLIASAITVTGVLWFDRVSPIVMGEDQAELSAAAAERLLAYHTGTNVFAYESRTVSVHLVWSELYDRTMVRARNMSTNIAQIMWIDPTETLPADGDYLTTVKADWYKFSTQTNDEKNPPYTRRIWNMAQPSNFTDNVLLTATFKKRSDNTLWPTTPSNQVALSKYFYNANQTNSQFDSDYTPFWQTAPATTQLCAFSCEFLHKLTISQTGYGFSASPLKMALNVQGDSNTLTVVSTDDTNSPTYKATRYTLSRDGLEDQTFVVQDYSAATNRKINHFFPHYTVPENNTGVVLPFDVRYLSSVSSRIDFAVIESKNINARLRFTFPEYAWVTETPVTKQVFLVASNDTDTADDSILYMIAFEGQTNYFSATQDDSGNYSQIQVTPISAAVNKGTTNTFEVSLNTNANCTPLQSRLVTTNNLFQAYSLMAGLKRSIWIGSIDDLTASNIIFYAGSGSTNAFYDNLPSPLSATVGDIWATGFSVTTNTSITTQSTWTVAGGLPLASFSADVQRQDEGFFIGDPGEQWDSSFDFDADYQSVYVEGGKLPYPSLSSIQSNRVSKITVYAVVGKECETTGLNPFLFHASLSTNGTKTTDGALLYPQSYDDITLGSIAFSSPITPLTQTLEINGSGYDSWTFGQNSEYQTKRLCKIAEFDNPTEQPTFNLGAHPLSFVSDVYDAAHTSETYDNGSWVSSFELWQRGFGLSMYVRNLIVVVDWNWEHCNKDVPYSPEVFTPEWATD